MSDPHAAQHRKRDRAQDALEHASDKLRSLVFRHDGDDAASGGGQLLWGLLRIRIRRCVGLRNLDMGSKLARLRGRKQDVSDPYVEAYLGGGTDGKGKLGGGPRLLKTRRVDNDLDPVFDEEFLCPVCHVASAVVFKVLDYDRYSKDDTIGTYTLSVFELIQRADAKDAELFHRVLREEPAALRPGDPLRVGLHKCVYLDDKKRHGSLEFFVEFIPARMLARTVEVPGVYFRASADNDVRLYVNADDDGSSPLVRYGGPHDDDRIWQPPRLWRDIYDVLCGAQHLVYMAGWSIDTDQDLLRGEEREQVLAGNPLGGSTSGRSRYTCIGRQETMGDDRRKGLAGAKQDHGMKASGGRQGPKYPVRIGELLKAKSEEGVAVNVMQWDDQSSNTMMPGMMGTCDEKTRNFFKNTKVKAKLMPMTGGESNTMIEGVNKKFAFTHHQKYIICDAPVPGGGGGRELFAFVGGIDLTTGRWDNQKHPLFRSLRDDFKGDFYTKCFHLSPENGPRQPWHDIHSAVRGPAALDLAQAFEERWAKQADATDLVNRQSLGLDNAKTLANKGGWCCQLSRSIDERVNMFDLRGAMKGRGSAPTYVVDEKLWRKVPEKNASTSKRFVTAMASSLCSNNTCLDKKKGRMVDNSIHLTNIHHIRRAKHFIFIESQYFISSSFMWSKDSEVKCGNLIAAEITYKICEKIAAREPFAAYILLPMWMEGIPQAKATQELLYYQRLTIEGMYKKVQEALVTRMANSSDHGLKATDYLNFYCIGTRETAKGNQATGSPNTGDEKLLAKTRRHQIYVHSKMMIVDDEVALIGTANVNQRSMDGCRDSEIMMTSWQPAHLATREALPKGDIHAFRLHAWATLTNTMDDVFRRPNSLECVHAVNDIADKNWRTYMAEGTTDMTSHLLPFPLEWDGTEIRPRRGLVKGNLPDTKASVMGQKSKIMPDLMLT